MDYIETQRSVWEWCRSVFPRHVGIKGRGVALIEEAVETGIAAGLTPEEILAAVQTPIKKYQDRLKSDPTHKEDLGEEIGDTLLCVYALAEEATIDSHQELDSKMVVNRSRPPEYYAAKTAHKESLGFILPGAPPRQPRHATETCLDFESEIEFLEDLKSGKFPPKEY